MKGPVNRGNEWLRAIMGEVTWASIRTQVRLTLAVVESV
jgi:hypothetical protein